MYLPGDTVTRLQSFIDSTGALAAATFGTCELYVDGTLDAATVTPATIATGEYSFTFTAPTGYSGGASHDMALRIPYTVAGVSSVMYIDCGQLNGSNAVWKLAETIEGDSGGDISPAQSLAVIQAMLFGLLADRGMSTEHFQNPAGTATRVAVSNDGHGNRLSTTITPP